MESKLSCETVYLDSVGWEVRVRDFGEIGDIGNDSIRIAGGQVDSG